METVLELNSLSEMPRLSETLLLLLRDMPTEKYCVVFDIDDTLVRDVDSDSARKTEAISEVCSLLFMFHRMGCIIGLVTARSTSMREETISELASLNINYSIYDASNLLFCPEEYRKSFTQISKWKKSARYFIKTLSKRKMLCTIGDQWTDLIAIKDDSYKQLLDQAYGSDKLRLLRLHDGISIFGIKLPVASKLDKDSGEPVVVELFDDRTVYGPTLTIISI
jgi:hypothetical protein